MYSIKRACFINWNKLFLWANYLLSLLYQSPHILCDLLVCDLGVDLRAGDRGVSHHLGDTLHRNTSFQGQCAKAMSCDMPSQRSADATRQTYGFEVGNKLVFGHRVGKYCVITAVSFFQVEFKYLFRYRMQGYQALNLCFLSRLADISFPIAIRFDL